MSRGKLIVIEGAHETGKQYQAEQLQMKLGSLAFPAIHESSVVDTLFVRAYKELAKTMQPEDAQAHHLLRAAKLSKIMSSTVKPNLESGMHVIMTRSWLSIAVEEQPNIDTLKRRRHGLDVAYGQLVVPDLTILLLVNEPDEAVYDSRFCSVDYLQTDARYGMHATVEGVTKLVIPESVDVLESQINEIVTSQLGIQL